MYQLAVSAAIFVITPYLMSILVAIYSIFHWTRWKQDHPSRLKHYLKRYEFVIILFTLFGGFYATIDLFRSKILYSRLTYFPLKQSECNDLKYLRFINFVLLENIPQFIIQLYYLIHYSNSDVAILPIVFLSLAMTVISLLFGGIKIGISTVDECIHSPKRNFEYETKLCGNFMIECKKLRTIHGFCHNKIQRCMLMVLNTCSDRSHWYGRSDAFYEIECYHIDCEYYLSKLTVYFELTIFTMTENHKNIVSRIRDNMVSMLNQESTPNANQFCQVKLI